MFYTINYIVVIRGVSRCYNKVLIVPNPAWPLLFACHPSIILFEFLPLDSCSLNTDSVVVPSLTPDDYNFLTAHSITASVVVPSLTPDDYNCLTVLAIAMSVVVPSLTPDDYNLTIALEASTSVVVPSLTPDDYN